MDTHREVVMSRWRQRLEGRIHKRRDIWSRQKLGEAGRILP